MSITEEIPPKKRKRSRGGKKTQKPKAKREAAALIPEYYPDRTRSWQLVSPEDKKRANTEITLPHSREYLQAVDGLAFNKRVRSKLVTSYKKYGGA